MATNNITGASIDKDELTKFGNMETIWWDATGPLKLLHQMNELRVPIVVEGLKQVGKLSTKVAESEAPLANLKLLDAGCGGGIVSEPLAQLGATVTGVDASSDLIKVAQLHKKENTSLKNNITYICSTLENLTDKYKNYFDVVVCSELIEHVASKETVMKSCVDMLKPGGSIFLSTINRTTLSWMYGIIFFEEVSNLVPKGTHEWDKFVTPEEVESFLKEHNCEVKFAKGYIYYGNKFMWSKDKSIHYVIHAVKKA